MSHKKPKKSPRHPLSRNANEQTSGYMSSYSGKNSETNDQPNKIRLNKYIAHSGICSRREADNLIQKGWVQVNGEVVREMGYRIADSDEVIVNGKKISPEKHQYILLNKPKGYVSTVEDPHAPRTVLQLVKNACSERIYPVGRLDKDTTGVLLLTNDGELTKKLTHPSYQKKKIYHVFLSAPFAQKDMDQVRQGLNLDTGFIQPDAVNYTDPSDSKQIGIELHSGENRIVRRIFEALGYSIEKLDRVYFAGLTKKSVKKGKWRFLTNQEIGMLKMMSTDP